MGPTPTSDAVPNVPVRLQGNVWLRAGLSAFVLFCLVELVVGTYAPDPRWFAPSSARFVTPHDAVEESPRSRIRFGMPASVIWGETAAPAPAPYAGHLLWQYGDALYVAPVATLAPTLQVPRYAGGPPTALDERAWRDQKGDWWDLRTGRPRSSSAPLLEQNGCRLEPGGNMACAYGWTYVPRARFVTFSGNANLVCALRDDGAPLCWGDADWVPTPGGLGLARDIQVMNHQLCALSEGGERVVCTSRRSPTDTRVDLLGPASELVGAGDVLWAFGDRGEAYPVLGPDVETLGQPRHAHRPVDDLRKCACSGSQAACEAWDVARQEPLPNLPAALAALPTLEAEALQFGGASGHPSCTAIRKNRASRTVP